MKLLFMVLGFILINAQNETKTKDSKMIIELSSSNDYSSKISKQFPAFTVGVWYRYPKFDGARLELGGNFKFNPSVFEFTYGKEGNNYEVKSKGYFLNFGGRLVKEFRIKKQRIEWISELEISNFFFDGKRIPDDPFPKPENENTIYTKIGDVESISTLQLGQGLRIWRKNIGFGIKTNFTPYRLWYKTTIPNQFNVFSGEATISIKL